jgi:hydrogenase-4 component E
MTTSSLFTLFMLGLFVGGTLASFTLMRLPSLLRSYAFSSVALGGLALALAFEKHAIHLVPVAVAVVAIKALLVPFVIKRMAERSQASLRLSSALRPAACWFVGGLVFASGILLAFQSPLLLGTGASGRIIELLPISVGVILLGLVMMILRRDLLSQLVGFLVLENGIAAFSLSALGGIPVAIEFGVYSAVLIGAILMATLSHRVQELFGTHDTSHLTELTD